MYFTKSIFETRTFMQLPNANISNMKVIKSYRFMWEFITSSGAESGIFQKNLVNTMDADALAPCVDWASSAIVLPIPGKCNLVFYKESTCTTNIISSWNIHMLKSLTRIVLRLFPYSLQKWCFLNSLRRPKQKSTSLGPTWILQSSRDCELNWLQSRIV